MNKEPILVFLGAGASIDLGMPSTNNLTDRVFEATRTVGPDFEEDPQFHRTQLLRAALTKAYGANHHFEQALHALESIESLKRSWRNNTSSQHRVFESSIFGPTDSKYQPLFEDHWTRRAIEALLNTVQRSIVDANHKVQTQPSWPHIQAFYRQLNEHFELTIATTNYDSVIEQALDWGAKEHGFRTEVDSSQFDLQSNARIFHLHGSTHWQWDSLANIMSYDKNPSVQPETYSSSPSNQAGHKVRNGPLITGLLKADKVIGLPYRSYVSRLQTRIEKCKRFVIAGYGFGDLYLNDILDDIWRHHGQSARVVFSGYSTKPNPLGPTDLGTAMWNFVQRFHHGDEPFHREADGTKVWNPSLYSNWAGLAYIAQKPQEIVDFLNS